MAYEDLLDKALEELPKRFNEHERFTIEKVKGHLEGNKTIVINLKQIAKHINRDNKHLLKYLLRETASAGKFLGPRAVFNTKISAKLLNKKITKYVSEFVYCSECNSPDTKLGVEVGVAYLRCQACGSKKPVKNL